MSLLEEDNAERVIQRQRGKGKVAVVVVARSRWFFAPFFLEPDRNRWQAEEAKRVEKRFQNVTTGNCTIAKLLRNSEF